MIGRKVHAAAAVLLFTGIAVWGQTLSRLENNTLRIGLDLVLVPVTVTDGENRPVGGLHAEHFRLWEDRIEQEIEYVSSETAPASVGILLDVSDSMKGALPLAREAVRTFLEMGDVTDEYFLMEFSDRPHMSEDFTAETGRLQSQLAFTEAAGSTALFDAVYHGLARVQEGVNPRKTLFVITDGGDNRSRYSQSDVEDYIRETGVQVYVIAVSATYGKSTLNDLSALTGGRTVFLGSASELSAACREIAREMKSQYMLGYVSSNAERNGKWRQLRVRVDPPSAEATADPVPPSHVDDAVYVRARRGYYASTF